MASRQQHAEARLRNLRWAIAIAEKQMAIPYLWRSMPEVMEEIPELRGVGGAVCNRFSRL